MPRSRAPSRSSLSSSQLVNGTIGDRSSAGRGSRAMPRFEPVPALGEGEAAQILRPLAQNVVEPHGRREIAQHFRGRGLAVEPLLQVVERGDLAVADHQQLAVQRHIRRHRRADVGKGAADLVAGARIEPLFGAAGDELHADAVPFPFGEIVARVEPGDVGILERLRQHQRAEGRQIADLGRRAPALEPIEERLVGRGEAVPDLLDAVELDAAPLGERGLGEPRRDADPQIRR